MIGISVRLRVYAFCEPVDMRKGFEGLAGVVREELGQDPLAGSVFVFVNRRRTHAKLLHFDGTGLCVLSKRLEKGRYVALWKLTDERKITITKAELELLLHGSHLIGRFKLRPDALTEKDLEVDARV